MAICMRCVALGKLAFATATVRDFQGCERPVCASCKATQEDIARRVAEGHAGLMAEILKACFPFTPHRCRGCALGPDAWEDPSTWDDGRETDTGAQCV